MVVVVASGAFAPLERKLAAASRDWPWGRFLEEVPALRGADGRLRAACWGTGAFEIGAAAAAELLAAAAAAARTAAAFCILRLTCYVWMYIRQTGKCAGKLAHTCACNHGGVMPVLVPNTPKQDTLWCKTANVVYSYAHDVEPSRLLGSVSIPSLVMVLWVELVGTGGHNLRVIAPTPRHTEKDGSASFSTLF